MAGRLVIDTNVFVSYLIQPFSVPGQAVARALREFQILTSDASRAELTNVLERPKFGRYISPSLRDPILDRIWSISELVAIPFPIRACRDPNDDKFLELAVHGHADFIITGDQDLLMLNPFRGIAILTPAAFLSLKTERP